MAESKTQSRIDAEAAEAAIDAKRPTLDQRGGKKMYHVGLTSDCPYAAINVPTVVMRGTVRGKCVSVPKKTANVHMGPNGILVHNEGQRDGNYEQLYDIEVDGFLKYVDTHVFRKTSDYEVPEVGPNGKATGKTVKHWRADIVPLDPALAGGDRALHDEMEVQKELMNKYVWIAPASVDRNGKPLTQGAQDSIAAQRAAGTFFWDIQKAEAAQVKPPAQNQETGQSKVPAPNTKK